MEYAILFGIICLALAGCAKHVPKDWFATSGSRADASIRMVITWNPNTEIPDYNMEQARTVAEQKCRSWGYDRAEAFGGVTQKCTAQRMAPFGGIVCDAMQAETEFQCLGAPLSQSPDAATQYSDGVTGR